MKPGNLILQCRQGKTYEKVFTIHTLNLTGYTARMTVRNPLPHDDVLIALDSSDGTDQLILETAGVFTEQPADWDEEADGPFVPVQTGWVNTLAIILTPAVTETFREKVYNYDIELESGDGKVYALMEGKFVVGSEQTRSGT